MTAVLAAWPLSTEADGAGPFMLGCIFVVAYAAAIGRDARRHAHARCCVCGGKSHNYATGKSGRTWCSFCWAQVTRTAGSTHTAVGR